jgi:arabinan endo-1,5-alpha-L-arabinosidase
MKFSLYQESNSLRKTLGTVARTFTLMVVLVPFALLSLADKNNSRKINDPKPIDSNILLYPTPIHTIRARDPFLIKDDFTKSYYMVVSSFPGFKTYISKDLKNWKDNGKCFIPGTDYWGTKDYWAPDIYKYQGKYYLLGTFSGKTAKRGTALLVAENINGPYQPLVNNAVTPANWVCLDGSLYIDDNNKPWIIYCHEWLEVTDGQILAQQLSDDLKITIGKPKLLFSASKASWTKAITVSGITGFVTDAPFIYRAKNGELLMTWSSFDKTGKYAIGLSRSESGMLIGPWKHDAATLNSDDGGHAMFFTDFLGNLMISYHSPNNANAVPVIYRVGENNGKLEIIK